MLSPCETPKCIVCLWLALPDHNSLEHVENKGEARTASSAEPEVGDPPSHRTNRAGPLNGIRRHFRGPLRLDFKLEQAAFA